MGLLSRVDGVAKGKAAVNTDNDSVVLDEMGKALKERIQRLPSKRSTPYVTLSLLKAYEAFQTGACLALQNDSYHSCASVGLGLSEIKIPLEKIWLPERAPDKYFPTDALPDADIGASQKGLAYWCFPLKSDSVGAKPWNAIIIIGAEDPSFNPRPIAAVLEDISDKLILQAVEDETENEPAQENAVSAEKAEEPEEITTLDSDLEEAEEAAETESVPDDSLTLKERIENFHRDHSSFNCIVLDLPEAANDEEKEKFSGRVSEIVNLTGTVVPLPSGCPLILLPSEADEELITHRLSKTLKTKALLNFGAGSPENVIDRIQSLI